MQCEMQSSIESLHHRELLNKQSEDVKVIKETSAFRNEVLIEQLRRIENICSECPSSLNEKDAKQLNSHYRTFVNLQTHEPTQKSSRCKYFLDMMFERKWSGRSSFRFRTRLFFRNHRKVSPFVPAVIYTPVLFDKFHGPELC